MEQANNRTSAYYMFFIATYVSLNTSGFIKQIIKLLLLLPVSGDGGTIRQNVAVNNEQVD